MKYLWCFFLFAAICLSQTDTIEMELISHAYDGATTASSLNGDILYANIGLKVLILDITDIHSPIILNEFSVPGEIADIIYYDDYLYIASKSGGIIVVDATDIYSPEIVRECTQWFYGKNHRWMKIVSDRLVQHVYRPDLEYSELICFNIENPRAITQYTISEIPNVEIGLELDSEYLYLVEQRDRNSYMKIYDIYSTDSAELIGDSISFDNNITEIAIDDTCLYFQEWSRFYVYNFSDPFSPVNLTFFYPYITGFERHSPFFVNNSIAFFKNGFDTINLFDFREPGGWFPYPALISMYGIPSDITDTSLIVHDRNKMAIFNYANPDSIFEVDSFEYSRYIKDDVIKKDNILISSSTDGVEFLGISDRRTPEIIANYPMDCVIDMVCFDNYLYVSSRRDSVLILNIGDLPDITEIGRLNVPKATLDIDSTYLYAVSNGDYDHDSHIYVFDLSMPALPTLVRSYYNFFDFNQFIVSNGIAFFENRFDDLIAFDVTGATADTVYYNDWSIGYNLFEIDDFVFVSSDSTTKIFTPQDSSHILADSIDLGSKVISMASYNNIAIAQTDYLLVLDISDPFDIEIIDTLDNYCIILDNMIFEENYLYSRTSYGELQIYELLGIPDPSSSTYIEAGWNLISYPFEDTTATSLVAPFALEPIYLFNTETAAYEETTALYPNTGFWILSEIYGNLAIDSTHSPIDTSHISIKRGWNLIGGPYANIPVSIFESYPEIMPGVFEYNNDDKDYELTDTLKIHMGYWIIATDSVEITIP